MSTQDAAKSRTFLWLAGLWTLLAIPVHAYLLSEHYALRFGEVSGNSLCNINELFSCATVSASRYAEFFGIPMALWGAAANIAFLLLLAWYPFIDATEIQKKGAARRNLLIVGGFIALTSIAMGSISTFLLSKYCPFCIGAYLLSFLSFAFLWLSLRNGPKAPVAAGDFAPLAILAAVFAFGVVIANDQIVSSYGGQDLERFAKEKAQEWLGATPVQIQTVEPLVMGASAEASKMTIVEFADFRCSHCKHAAPVMKAFVSSHPDARLEFEVWPLDGECNRTIPSSNGASCLLARAVLCAQKIGQQGWAAHEYVYDHQDKYADVESVRADLPQIAAAAKVPADQMATCSNAPETKASIEKEAAIGSALNLGGTPTVYVNGKKLVGGQVLEVLTETYKVLPK
jgi:protein-disulfide isomerase